MRRPEVAWLIASRQSEGCAGRSRERLEVPGSCIQHEGTSTSEAGALFNRDDPGPNSCGREILLKVGMVGFCGSDLNSFRGLNPLVSYPRILGHEVSATASRFNKILLSLD